MEDQILVVEDDVEMAAVLREGFEQDKLRVRLAQDGSEGLGLARTGQFQAIVLDVMLPVMDGYAVARELRQLGDRTPILMLTARDATSDRIRGLDSGADDYLVKPFELAELHARLRALIRRAAGRPHPVITIQDITVDTVNRTVARDGEPIPLTAMEYSLVELLALHRGELVTRTMIYDHLFNEDDESFSNLVDVHISNVRRKIGKDFITTRRGQGYLLDD